MSEQRGHERWQRRGLRSLILAAALIALAVRAATAQEAGTLSVGGGLGFLADTTDDTAFALNFHGDYFLTENVSLGPLVQLAFTGDLTQIGASGQAKYWLAVTGQVEIVFQGGVGFVHANHRDDDTAFLIPLGVGIDYALNPDVSVNATFLVNFTDLDTGRGRGGDTTLMPGLTFGIRF